MSNIGGHGGSMFTLVDQGKRQCQWHDLIAWSTTMSACTAHYRQRTYANLRE